ncbi:MAG: sulfur carrier protein ThiS, partial [Cyanobium sp. 49614_E6]|nr:sulfur carrier protein ThiS [Cyanobium sp. 49614_E6]
MSPPYTPEHLHPELGQTAITVQVNGEQLRCASGQSLHGLLTSLGYRPELVVVEFNGAILARSHWPGQEVVESDVLEVVT